MLRLIWPEAELPISMREGKKQWKGTPSAMTNDQGIASTLSESLERSCATRELQHPPDNILHVG